MAIITSLTSANRPLQLYALVRDVNECCRLYTRDMQKPRVDRLCWPQDASSSTVSAIACQARSAQTVVIASTAGEPPSSPVPSISIRCPSDISGAWQNAGSFHGVLYRPELNQGSVHRAPRIIGWILWSHRTRFRFPAYRFRRSVFSYAASLPPPLRERHLPSLPARLTDVACNFVFIMRCRVGSPPPTTA
jgi:hypothetical protein